jgi:3-carboxy-cis,cis-muconate cycloisomerase
VAQAETIAACCMVELMDSAALSEAAASAGNLAIPLVRQLTALVAARDAEASRYVHFGATSQDIIDTALVLQMRAALTLIRADLDRAIRAARTLVVDHRATTMVGRTWMQQALPITFGLKMAGTLDALARHRLRVSQMQARVLVLQFGGAAGTLASLGAAGPAISAALARHLDLPEPALPWHGHRDRMFDCAGVLAGLTATAGKVARDLALMGQTEVAEVAEGGAPGRGGSSTMPHKRNPIRAAAILAAAHQTPGLVATIAMAGPGEHERALGGWQAEWRAMPELIRLSGGAISQLADLLETLEVMPEGMAASLATTGGLIMAEAVQMALAPALGRLVAHERLEGAVRESAATGRPFIDVLAADSVIAAHLDRDALAALIDPAHYLGATALFIDRVLADTALDA